MNEKFALNAVALNFTERPTTDNRNRRCIVDRRTGGTYISEKLRIRLRQILVVRLNCHLVAFQGGALQQLCVLRFMNEVFVAFAVPIAFGLSGMAAI